MELISWIHRKPHWLSLLFCCCSFVSAEEFQVTDLFGKTIEASVTAIDAKGVHLKSGGKSGLRELSDLRSIRKKGKPSKKQSTPSVELMLAGGGRLLGKQVTMDEENCTLHGCSLSSNPLPVPLDFVRAVILVPKLVTLEMRQELIKPREEDRFLVQIDDTIETLDGLVEGLSENELSFSWNDVSRKLKTADVLAIGIADAGAEIDGDALIHFLDGQAIVATVSNLKADALAVQLFGEPRVLSWKQVSGIEIMSERLRFLSDLKPETAIHKPIVTTVRPWQRDRSVGGEQLKLGETTYAKGIGVASWSSLKFSLAGEYSTFCATIGIDSSTEGRGDCIFVVRGDGKELVREAMKGTDPAKAVRVELGNTQELELMVLPGNDLDLSDRANWCDACVLK